MYHYTGAKTEATSIRGIQPGCLALDASDGCGLDGVPLCWKIFRSAATFGGTLPVRCENTGLTGKGS